MPFLLRLDIDKPYGHHNLVAKIFSKAREDYYFPAINSLGYLEPTIAILSFLNKNHIPAFLYFRNCTVPNQQILKLIDEGNYQLGFHAENTRTIETFKEEFFHFKKTLGRRVQSFTKHGSGTYKLGRYHYPVYDPVNYRKWANELDLDYSLGNGMAASPDDLLPVAGFFKDMFWLESSYRQPGFNEIEKIASLSAKMLIPVVSHPSNYYTYPQVKKDLLFLVQFSKVNNIEWLHRLPFK